MQQNLIDAARAIGTKPVAGRYFLCLCGKCGWLGSSEECRLVEDPLFGDGEYFCAVCGASEPDEVDAAEAFNAILAATASRHPDDVAVDRFALAMKAKLADAPAQVEQQAIAEVCRDGNGQPYLASSAGNILDLHKYVGTTLYAAKTTQPATDAVDNPDNEEIDRVVNRLESSDPDFDDCNDAVILLRKYKKLCREIGRGDSYHLVRIDRVCARLAAQVEQQVPDKWQPISTAPKDGTVVLGALVGSDIPQPVRYVLGGWRLSWDGHPVAFANGPTHWQPLPEAPTQQAGARLAAEAKGGSDANH